MDQNIREKDSWLFGWVSVIFVTCLMVSNIVAFKLIRLGPIVITPGALLFPVTYIVNDLISEVYGFRKARRLIWQGFAMNFCMVAFIQLVIALPYPVYFEGQNMFAAVLGNTLRVLLGSFVAYLAGSFMNAYVMSRMKVKTQGKYLGLRAILSTLVGEALDSTIFICIVFYGVMPREELWKMILVQTAVKTAYEIVIFPVTSRVIRAFKRYEGIDTYDTNVNYNPFSFKEG